MIGVLVKAGADPKGANPDGETVLMTASRSGSVEAVKTLLALGADPNAKEGWFEQTAVMWAAANNDAAVVNTLVENGAQVNARSKTLPGQQPRAKGADTAFQSAHSNFPEGRIHAAPVRGAGTTPAPRPRFCWRTARTSTCRIPTASRR